MTPLREFFSRRILMNCMFFAVPMSVLFTLRMTYVMHIPFFSKEGGQAYLLFVALTFIALRLFLFVLYLLGSREEKR